MSSGEKRIIVNLNERAASGDIVRAQDVAAQQRNDALRYLFSKEIRGGFYSNPGLVQPFTALPPAPPADVEPAHQCLAGLMVRPDNAGYLLIDPGVAAFFVPSFAGLTADDSPWILVDSPGVTSTTQLLFVANGGPGIRWDIVECQPAADAVTESVTRDVFDPGTQTVTPTLLAKVRRSQLTFRIRAGVQGAGIPDIDPAWMALAAVHVRTDSAGFTTTDLYDLRPLEAERCTFGMRHPLSAPASGRRYRCVLHEAELRSFTFAGINGMALSGYFRSDFGGYWSGGEIRTNLPATNTANFSDAGITGSDFDGFNFENANLRSGAFALVANNILTLGAFFPRGYPRWVRYGHPSQTPNTTNRLRTSGRVPQGCRGILMALDTEDGGGLVQRNGIIEPATLPTYFGETQPAWGHVVAYAALGNSATAVFSPEGSSRDGIYRWAGYTVTEGGALDPNINSHSLLLGPAVTIDLDGVNRFGLHAEFNPGVSRIPMNATGVLITLVQNYTIATGGFLQPEEPAVAYETANGFGFAIPGIDLYQVRNDSGGNASFFIKNQFVMPLRPNLSWDGIGPVDTMELAFNWATGGFAVLGSGLTLIDGYQF